VNIVVRSEAPATESESQRTARWLLRDGAAALVCLSLAVAWTFPLIQHFSDRIPGAEIGDNVAALWNFWWARFAMANGLDLFHTGHLFAPEGTSLSMHSNVALPAISGATVLGWMPLIAAHNALLLATLFLNGICAYWLARRVTRDWLSSIFAAITFAGSPFISGHLHGHFNVLSAWTLPLVALSALAMANGSMAWALMLGVSLGTTVYLDYYYAVYAIGLAALLLLLHNRSVSLTFEGSSRRSPRALRWLGVAITVVAAALTVIIATGGFDLPLGTVVIRAHDTFNLRQVLWLLVAAWLFVRWRPGLTWQLERASSWTWPGLALCVTAAAVISSPVWLRIIRLIVDGDYVSQPYHWRSGVQGVDLITLVAGNPFSAWSGSFTRALYRSKAIDPIEQSGWLGVAPMVLTVLALRSKTSRTHATAWLLTGFLALLWALGPHLFVLGQNSGLILPNAILRYVPLLSNARVPGRALVLTYLGLSLVSAMCLAALRRRGLGLPLALGLLGLLVIDFAPLPFPLVALDHPRVYDVLRTQADRGAVLELPFGMRDGFGEDGAFDERILWYQTIHERPLIGGFVARISPHLRRAYEEDPLLSSLLRLSTGDAAGPPDALTADVARLSMRRLGISFVVLDRRTAPPSVVGLVEQRLPLTLLARDEDHALYGVNDVYK
jgi:hypothetical protein